MIIIASKNGPYSIDHANSVESGLNSKILIMDAQGNQVIDFPNDKAVHLVFDNDVDAQAAADALSNDDTVYLAKIRAHYFGESTNTDQTAAINQAILLIEGASFASDPAAVSALGVLARALLL